MQKNILKFFMMLLFSTQIFGQEVISIDKNFTTKDINNKVMVYTQSVGVEELFQIINAKQSNFKKNTASQDVSYGYHWQQGWCKFSVQNNSENTRFILHIEQSRADTVQLFVQKPYQIIQTYPLIGRHVPINERPIIDRNYVYPIEIPPYSTLNYYLYSSRKVGLHGCILTLKSEREYARYFGISSAQFGFIFGSSVLTGLMGLALFFFIREKTYLVYSLYCFSTLLVGLSDAGYIHSYIHLPVIQPIINIATIICFYLLVGLHILFTIELLNIKAYKTKWFYFLGKYSSIFFISCALILLFPTSFKLTWWLVYISYYMVFFMDAYISIAIIIGIIKKHPSAYFYMVGFFLTLIIFTILMLANFGVIDRINNNVDSFYFTPLIEILVMVIGLGMRFSGSIQERFVFQKKLNEVQLQIITLQEDERTRIARDLHDDVGNSLAALKTKFEHEKRVEDISQTQQIINDLRDITHNIMPTNFQEYSLEKMLETLIKRFQNHPKIVFEYITAGVPVKIDSNKELAIYRILNELINNLLKYSKATSCVVQLIYQEDQMSLSFEDNGEAFLLKEQHQENTGIGIKSMLARLDFIHAKFSTNSDNNGNILLIDIPYKIHE